MGFSFPHPPTHLTFSPSAQTGAEIVCFAAAGAFLVFAMLEFRKLRSFVPFLLLLGGILAYFNEPFDDTLGLVWFARPHAHVWLHTLGPVPLWGMPTYILVFGGMPYLFLKLFREGRFTLKRFWICAASFLLLDLAIEVPVIQLHLYSYYSFGGSPPLEIGGSPVLDADQRARADSRRDDPVHGAALLPWVARAACRAASARHVRGLRGRRRPPGLQRDPLPHTTEVVRWGAAVASIAIALLILDALSRVILARTRADLQAALPSEPDAAGCTVFLIGPGEITNAAIQNICPLAVAEHLLVASTNPIASPSRSTRSHLSRPREPRPESPGASATPAHSPPASPPANPHPASPPPPPRSPTSSPSHPASMRNQCWPATSPPPAPRPADSP